jgi:hypothetical protein
MSNLVPEDNQRSGVSSVGLESRATDGGSPCNAPLQDKLKNKEYHVLNISINTLSKWSIPTGQLRR